MKIASDRFKNDQPITYVRKKNILFLNLYLGPNPKYKILI